MLIPDRIPAPLPEDDTLLTLSRAATLDKALINRALTREIVPHLPAIVDRLTDIATHAEKDSDALSASAYLLDRVAGKPTQQVETSGTLGLYAIPAEEVQARLAHLREKK